jgi:hypothetical protein
MIPRYFGVAALSVLLSTAANAQCSGVGQQLASAYYQWKAVQAADAEAEQKYTACVKTQAQNHCKSLSLNDAQYSACVKNQTRLEDQANKHCNDAYSKAQSAKENLEAAVSDYEDWRGNGCVQQPGRFDKTGPLGVWPPAR